jgi:hypothetical protein
MSCESRKSNGDGVQAPRSRMLTKQRYQIAIPLAGSAEAA